MSRLNEPRKAQQSVVPDRPQLQVVLDGKAQRPIFRSLRFIGIPKSVPMTAQMVDDDQNALLLTRMLLEFANAHEQKEPGTSVRLSADLDIGGLSLGDFWSRRLGRWKSASCRRLFGQSAAPGSLIGQWQDALSAPEIGRRSKAEQMASAPWNILFAAASKTCALRTGVLRDPPFVFYLNEYSPEHRVDVDEIMKPAAAAQIESTRVQAGTSRFLDDHLQAFNEMSRIARSQRDSGNPIRRAHMLLYSAFNARALIEELLMGPAKISLIVMGEEQEMDPISKIIVRSLLDCDLAVWANNPCLHSGAEIQVFHLSRSEVPIEGVLLHGACIAIGMHGLQRAQDRTVRFWSHTHRMSLDYAEGSSYEKTAGQFRRTLAALLSTSANRVVSDWRTRFATPGVATDYDR